MTGPVDLTLFMPALNEELSIRRTVVAAVEASEVLVADGVREVGYSHGSGRGPLS